MKQYLEKIRKPNSKFSLRVKIFVSIALILSGFALGVFQKWLDSLAVNELPYILQAVDVTNFFGRPAVWIFIGTVIAVYASSPLRAGINCFLFFISMVSGYYLYCHFVLSFLPKSYMLIWIVFSFASHHRGRCNRRAVCASIFIRAQLWYYPYFGNHYMDLRFVCFTEKMEGNLDCFRSVFGCLFYLPTGNTVLGIKSNCKSIVVLS